MVSGTLANMRVDVCNPKRSANLPLLLVDLRLIVEYNAPLIRHLEFVLLRRLLLSSLSYAVRCVELCCEQPLLNDAQAIVRTSALMVLLWYGVCRDVSCAVLLLLAASASGTRGTEMGL